MPISTQWGPQGYFYPIQIAQYGLSHYSKYQADPSRLVTLIEDAENGLADKWTLVDSKSTVDSVVDPVTANRVIQFSTASGLYQSYLGSLLCKNSFISMFFECKMRIWVRAFSFFKQSRH